MSNLKAIGAPPHNGGGGRFGSGHSSKSTGKPSYMSHVPDHMLDAHQKMTGGKGDNSMSHQNLMACKAGLNGEGE